MSYSLEAEYYDQYAADAEQVRQLNDVIREQLPDYPRVDSYLNLLMGLPTNPGFSPHDYVNPLPSQKLLACAYHDMRKGVSARSEERRFIGQTILPMSGAAIEEPLIHGHWAKGHTIGACTYAEEGFVNGMLQALTNRYFLQPYVKVLHTSDGVPAILYKNYSFETGVTLEALIVDDMLIAPMTLVDVADIDSMPVTGEIEADQYKLATHMLPDNPGLSPIRLTPWSIQDKRLRQLHAMRTNGSETYEEYDRGITILAASRALLQATAVTIGQKCGVEFNGNPLSDVLASHGRITQAALGIQALRTIQDMGSTHI